MTTACMSGLNHDELYVRFAEVWPEVLAFIRTGRFSSAADRTAPRGDPLAAPGATMTAPRRQLATRRAGWAVALARWLARTGVRPNGGVDRGHRVRRGAADWRSCAPDGFAPRGARCLLMAAAAGIQLRLLCNLLDGMLAVEEGLKSKTGDIYNEVPDRLADILILVGAGYSVRRSSVRRDARLGGGARRPC